MSPLAEPAVRLEVHDREPFADGHRFPGTGAYEVLTATAHSTVDPGAPAHRSIPTSASRRATGAAWCGSAVTSGSCVDGGRRRLLVANAGNGLLRRRGYTVVFRCRAGRSAAGRRPAPARSARGDTERVTEPGGGSDQKGRATAVVPSRHDLHIDGGFRPGWIHELTYEAEEPLVLGLGLVAVRDLVGHLRHDAAYAETTGSPSPPRTSAHTPATHARQLLLEEDVERAVALAADWSAPRHRFELP
ncbi:hypothetical protein ABZ490_42085 [Streptomyces sp. NPDC005811]|uniref:hypothetical protein n=1 Tax=Streptomyces sp. NPDC005811 TaxID=3154565 RepID=UPI0033C824B6